MLKRKKTLKRRKSEAKPFLNQICNLMQCLKVCKLGCHRKSVASFSTSKISAFD